jgi:predicted metal-binding membrane protein
MAFRVEGWYRRCVEQIDGDFGRVRTIDANAAAVHLEKLAKRDRGVAAVALALLTVLAWVYLFQMSAATRGAATEAEMHGAMGMAGMNGWGPSDVAALFVMWVVMMAGMMLPSAAPMILLVAGTHRRQGGPYAQTRTAAFAGGYLVAWIEFSLAAALAQAALHAGALMSSSMETQSPRISGVIFLAAGVYQWSPLKHLCLARCRSPVHFVSEHWREGISGAFTLGLQHGLFCIGCCWVLMALLFAAGVMNLAWVAAIGGLVLVEKILKHGPAAGRVAGVAFAVWGLYLLTLAA